MLMFGTIERPHPAIALDPDADIEQRIIDFAARRQDLREMTPVHECEMHRTGNADIGHIAENKFEKGSEFRVGHLAGGHRKVSMTVLARSTGMAIDWDIERGVGQGKVNPLVRQQDTVSIGIPGIPAEQAMWSQQPKISAAADRDRANVGEFVGSRIAGYAPGRIRQQDEVELASLKTG